MKWIFVVGVLLVSLVLFCCCKVSGDESRKEETEE